MGNGKRWKGLLSSIPGVQRSTSALSGSQPPTRGIAWTLGLAGALGLAVTAWIASTTSLSTSVDLGNDRAAWRTLATNTTQDQLRQAIESFLDLPPDSVGKRLHRWRVLAALNGHRAKLKAETLELLRIDGYRRAFPGAPGIFIDGIRGIEVMRFSVDIRKRGFQYESHVDQLLATCAEVGVPIDEVIETGSTKTTVRGLLQASQKNFVRGQAAAWSLTAYCLYLPNAPEWTNHFGETFSYDDIANDLTRVPIGSGPCSGTHTLYAMGIAMAADKKGAFLEAVTRRRIDSYLHESASRLRHSQRPNGAWSDDWHSPSGKDAGDESSVERFLLVTSHHIEWLELVAENIDFDPEYLVKACHFLQRALCRQSKMQMNDNYCGTSHACRTVSGIIDEKRE